LTFPILKLLHCYLAEILAFSNTVRKKNHDLHAIILADEEKTRQE